MIFIRMQQKTQCVCNGCGSQFMKVTAYVKRSKTGKHYCSEKCSRDAALKASVVARGADRIFYGASPLRCTCGNPISFENRKCSKYCSHKCAALATTKGRKLSSDTKRDISNTLKSKYKSGELKSRQFPLITKQCPTCKHIFNSSVRGRKFCSHKCSHFGRDLSRNGGYRERGGRGKQGWYNGYHCQSSWELAWVIYAMDHSILFERNTVGFDYIFEGTAHKYYPDFRLSDGTYVEIKGYNSKQWEAKKLQFQSKLDIIDRIRIKPFIKYAVDKHGKDYIRLYETINHHKNLPA